jgi:hypothetical protein
MLSSLLVFFFLPWVQSNVAVDLYVMSQCPDALLCEHVFSSVLKQVGALVDLKVNYVGVSEIGNEPQCKHGSMECLLNKQQLCAQALYPESFFNFILCQNENIRKDTMLQCAQELDYDFDELADCVDNEGSSKLLQSAKESAAANVKTSCSIFFNKKKRCVHDGSWYDCPLGYSVSDFVNSICELATEELGHEPAECLELKLQSDLK